MSFPTELVLPDSISCLCLNNFCLEWPLPLSSSPWVNTPNKVDLPASTFPTTATRISKKSANKLFHRKTVICATKTSSLECEKRFSLPEWSKILRIRYCATVPRISFRSRNLTQLHSNVFAKDWSVATAASSSSSKRPFSLPSSDAPIWKRYVII